MTSTTRQAGAILQDALAKVQSGEATETDLHHALTTTTEMLRADAERESDNEIEMCRQDILEGSVNIADRDDENRYMRAVARAVFEAFSESEDPLVNLAWLHATLLMRLGRQAAQDKPTLTPQDLQRAGDLLRTENLPTKVQ